MYRNVTAIIADDDKDSIDVFYEYLQMLNVDVVGIAYHGMAAVDLYRQTKPDIVFLDLMMPKYDGIFALENIRKIQSDANVVIITGNLSSDSEQRLENLKPIKVISKPFEVAQIMDVIENIEKDMPE